MKTNKQLLPFVIIIGIILVVGGYAIYRNIEKTGIKEIKTTEDIDIKINTDDGDEKINWDSYEETDITEENGMTITKAGTYNLSGEINGSITVKTTGNVKLVLNNVNIKSKNGPAIIIEEAENTVIYLTEGTTNILEDSTSYSYSDEDINGVIYSKDDLILDGTGTLNINSNYQDGIVSKDDLKIINGTYNITSKDDGIRGKDSVYILNGNFDITSGGDAIKSTNDTDSEKGYILVENGTFNIESELDGLQAETKVVIKNGNFNIKTGGGSINSSSNNNEWGKWGRNPYEETTTNTSSAKGLKSVDNLVINNGVFTFDTSDDSIHSNNYVGIKNGDINISSGDDGIHADTELIIDSGTINITKSYEGLESAKMTINNGNISVIASDDGINIAGGNDSSSMNRPGQNNYSNNSDNILTINNGTIYVNATGDGIDVNGSGYIYDGTITVDGPTNNGNGTLDYDREFVVDGGTFIGAGSNGMLQNISSTKQYNVTISFSNSYESNTEVSILDSNNNEIISYTPTKTFSSIIISTPKLKQNETYTIKVNNETYTTFTSTSYSTSVGSRGEMMNGGGHQPPGRR